MLNLFFWTFLPQVAFLALFHKAGSAWVNGTFLVLGESAAIIALLFESFLVVSLASHNTVLVLNKYRTRHKSTSSMQF